jgi:nucleoside-diphosphate-sugar epimerase
MDAIIHPGEVAAGDRVSDQLDYLMRCTYNLLWAASEEGVPRLIYLSTLRVMDRYDEEFVVTEQWRPVPITEMSVLRYHVGEYVCREFVRESKIDCVFLRLGGLVWDDVKAGDLLTSALYPDDMIQAVESALKASVQGWDVFHVQSAVSGARFLTTSAEESLGYQPVSRGQVRG